MTVFISKMISALILIALAAAGCTGGERDYFPLTPGLKWTYEIQSRKSKVLPDIMGDAGGPQISKEIEIREVLPEETVEGQKAIPVRLTDQADGDATNKNILVLYYRVDDNGVYVLARKTPSGTVKKGPRVNLIKFPLKDNLTWQDEGEDMTLNSKLEALAEPVITKGGSFKNCIKIQRTGTNYPKSYSYEYISYYAPGVGLIKYEVVSVTKEMKREIKGELVNFSR